ncbi:MAG: hypothetical protein RJB38_1873, partial [Pseudomonadota bacterium]
MGSRRRWVERRRALCFLSVSSVWFAVIGCSGIPTKTIASSQGEISTPQRDPAFQVPRKSVAVTDLCVCVVGAGSEQELLQFKQGCSVWFTRNSCESRLRIEEGSLEKEQRVFERLHQGAEVAFGYSGPWTGSHQTQEWLKREIAPALRGTSLHVSVDATLRPGWDDSNALRQVADELLKKDVFSSLTVRSHQALSTGLWDQIPLGSNPFWVEYRATPESLRGPVFIPGAQDATLSFPACAALEGTSCTTAIHGGATGYCENQRAGLREKLWLACTPALHSGESQWTRHQVDRASAKVDETVVRFRPVVVVGLKANRFYDVVRESDNRDDPDELKALENQIREAYLKELPGQIHVDLGHEAFDERMLEREAFDVNDVVIKKRGSRYSQKLFTVRVKAVG